MAYSSAHTPDKLPVPSPRGLTLRVRLVGMALLACVPPVIVALLLPVRDGNAAHVAVFLSAVLLSALVAFHSGTRITRPIVRLIDDAQTLAAGVTGHRSSIVSGDEIGMLATAFNQTAATMERRNAALADNERRYRFLFDSNPLPMWA